MTDCGADRRHPKAVEEHVEIAKVFSRNGVQQRFEEHCVGWERNSERGVEQVVDVPTGQMAEVCPCLARDGSGGHASEEVLRKVHRQGTSDRLR